MIIHTPEITRHEGQVCVSARVEIRRFVENYPETLWFRFPEDCQSYVSDRCDGFLTSLLLVAMYFSEDLEVRGKISPKLAYGIEEQQCIFNLWFPKRFNRINIKYNHMQEFMIESSAMEVASAFTGGVDSFHTLWSHLPENQPNRAFQVNNGLFIHGIDLDYRDEDRFLAASQIFSHLFESIGLRLITAQTNARDFSKLRIDWNYGHGGPVIGTALILGRLLRRFYVPSTFSYQYLRPLGTSPVLDHLASTESLEIVHVGAAVNRIEKLGKIKNWGYARRNLRVCSDQTKLHGVMNCCRCHKCLRTMLMLEVLGEQGKFPTFEKPLGFWKLFYWTFLVRSSAVYAGQILRMALRKRMYLLVLPALVSIAISRAINFLVNLTWANIPKEMQYRIKTKYYGNGRL